jgi:hypothetical protein
MVILPIAMMLELQFGNYRPVVGTDVRADPGAPHVPLWSSQNMVDTDAVPTS